MVYIPTLVGAHVKLRKIRETDIEDRYRIGRHHAFVHMCGGDSMTAPVYPGREVWVKWYENNKETPFYWVMEVDGHCIGYANFHRVSETDRSAVYRIGIFDPNYHAKGLGTETTRLLLAYGFEIMQWHRIELRVLEYNHRAIRCYEKCGFVREGILRESAWIDGRFYSDIVMGILAPAYFQESAGSGEKKP